MVIYVTRDALAICKFRECGTPAIKASQTDHAVFQEVSYWQ